MAFSSWEGLWSCCLCFSQNPPHIQGPTWCPVEGQPSPAWLPSVTAAHSLLDSSCRQKALPASQVWCLWPSRSTPHTACHSAVWIPFLYISKMKTSLWVPCWNSNIAVNTSSPRQWRPLRWSVGRKPRDGMTWESQGAVNREAGRPGGPVCFSQGCLGSSRACVSLEKKKEASRKADSFLSHICISSCWTCSYHKQILSMLRGFKWPRSFWSRWYCRSLFWIAPTRTKLRASVLSRFNHVWLFATPWSLPGSSVHGIFQARILEWVAISFSRKSSWPSDQTQASFIARWVLYHQRHLESGSNAAGFLLPIIPAFSIVQDLITFTWAFHSLHISALVIIFSAQTQIHLNIPLFIVLTS